MSVCLSFCLTGFQIWVYLENCNCIEYYQVCCQDWWWGMCRHRPDRIKSCYVLPTNVSADCFLIPGFVVVLTHACNVSWFGMEKGKRRWQMWHISNWFLLFVYDLDVKYSHQRTTPHLQPHYIPHFQHCCSTQICNPWQDCIFPGKGSLLDLRPSRAGQWWICKRFFA